MSKYSRKHTVTVEADWRETNRMLHFSTADLQTMMGFFFHFCPCFVHAMRRVGRILGNPTRKNKVPAQDLLQGYRTLAELAGAKKGLYELVTPDETLADAEEGVTEATGEDATEASEEGTTDVVQVD